MDGCATTPAQGPGAFYAALTDQAPLTARRKHSPIEAIDFIDGILSYALQLRGILLFVFDPESACHLQQGDCLRSGKLTESWRARREWSTPTGTVDRNRFCELFGSCVVPLSYDALTEVEIAEQSLPTEVTIAEFLASISDPEYEFGRRIYAKDWHFALANPTYIAYEVPPPFSVDWLNQYCLQRNLPNNTVRDDYRFVYYGPSGSRTLCHCDVLGSYSWSTNIAGRKSWLFVCPDQVDYLFDDNRQQVKDLRDTINSQRFPRLHLAKIIEVIQGPGETIFVPSGWYHQVDNLEETISINHNWLNACSVDLVFATLQEDLRSAEHAIRDCKDMDDWHLHTQRLLKANSSFDFSDFADFLRFIVDDRLAMLNMSPLTLDPKANSFISFELRQILPVLEEIANRWPFEPPGIEGTDSYLSCHPHNIKKNIEKHLFSQS